MTKKLQLAWAFTTHALVILLLAVLAFAGIMSFLGTVDPVVSYPLATVFVLLLVKELL